MIYIVSISFHRKKYLPFNSKWHRYTCSCTQKHLCRYTNWLKFYYRVILFSLKASSLWNQITIHNLRVPSVSLLHLFSYLLNMVEIAGWCIFLVFQWLIILFGIYLLNQCIQYLKSKVCVNFLLSKIGKFFYSVEFQKW